MYAEMIKSKLTDGSYVFDVRISHGWPVESITINCISEKAAYDLLASLSENALVEIH